MTTSASSAGAGSLRSRIKYVNDNAALYNDGTLKPQKTAMVFDEPNFPVSSLTVNAALPAFVKPAQFLGGRLEASRLAANQDRLWIQGATGTSALHGLRFDVGSSGSTVENLGVFGFTKGSALVLASGANTVKEFYAGVNWLGLVAPNRIGLEVVGPGATGNTIGLPIYDQSTANWFAGNTVAGVVIRDGASGNLVQGSIIGNAGLAYNASYANGDGVRISGGFGNSIGNPNALDKDLAATFSNLIAGNRSSGVRIIGAQGSGLADANRVRNNYIAYNQGVVTPVGGLDNAGIAVQNSTFALIGGTRAIDGNTIVRQGYASPGSATPSSATPTPGILVQDSSDVRIAGNAVGVDADQMIKGLGNSGDGISVDSSQRVSVYGGNVIGSNGVASIVTRIGSQGEDLLAVSVGHGIAVRDGSTGVSITNNRIGSVSSTLAAGNSNSGVAIFGSIGNVVGQMNVISHNAADGVLIGGAKADTTAAGNRVQGSRINNNSGSGVRIRGSSGTTVGGANAADANVILLNGGDGVTLESSDANGAATGNLVQGNHIGTNTNRVLQTSRLRVGNVGWGVSIKEGVSNTVQGNVLMNNNAGGISVTGGTGSMIGGSTPAQGNVVGSNGGDGVRLGGGIKSGAIMGHVVMANQITNNGGCGVQVASGSGVQIGQKVTAKGVTGMGNLIEDNGAAMVVASGSEVMGTEVHVGANAKRVSVQGNTGCIGKDINIDGVIDGMVLRNAEVSVTLTSAKIQPTVSAGTSLQISGTVGGSKAVAYQQYSLDFFAEVDGERRFLGRGTWTAGPTGAGTFSVSITADVDVDETITVAATSLRYEPGASYFDATKSVRVTYAAIS